MGARVCTLCAVLGSPSDFDLVNTWNCTLRVQIPYTIEAHGTAIHVHTTHNNLSTQRSGYQTEYFTYALHSLETSQKKCMCNTSLGMTASGYGNLYTRYESTTVICCGTFIEMENFSMWRFHLFQVALLFVLRWESGTLVQILHMKLSVQIKGVRIHIAHAADGWHSTQTGSSVY